MHNIQIRVPEVVMTKLDSMNLLDGQIHLVPWTETEKDNTYNLPKRSRYYQAQIDVSLLEPGSVNFNRLNDLTTILVAPFDIFGYGLYRYTFEEYCQEIPGLRLNDGARRIFINTKGTNPEGFSREFLDFMEYINSSTDDVAEKAESEKIQRIHNRVRTVKQSEKIGVKLMQKWEEMYYEKKAAREEGLEEGRKEGLKEGLKEGRREILKEMVLDGIISVEEAAKRLGVPVEDF